MKRGAPIALDAGWRVSLMFDGMAAALRSVPRRAPAVVLLTALSLAFAIVGTRWKTLQEATDTTPPTLLGPLEPAMDLGPADEPHREDLPPTGVDLDKDGIADRVEAEWLLRVAPDAPCEEDDALADQDEMRRRRAVWQREGCWWRNVNVANDLDADGRADSAEGSLDRDDDGVPDFVDPQPRPVARGERDDPDLDGLSTQEELRAGTSPFARDSDGDGYADAVEAPLGARIDTDGDGDVDGRDTDADGDGTPDADEGLLVEEEHAQELEDKWTIHDTDGDLVANRLDRDDDDDGIPTLVENGQPADIDDDTLPNALDDDSDGDGVLDREEGAFDRDGDGTLDFVDVDDAIAPTPVKDVEAEITQMFAGIAWLAGLCTQPFLVMPGSSRRRRVKSTLVGVAGWLIAAAFITAATGRGELTSVVATVLVLFAFGPFVLSTQALVLDGSPVLRAVRDAVRRPLSTIAMHAAVAIVITTLLMLIGTGLALIVGIAAFSNETGELVTAVLSAISISVLATLWLVAIGGYARAAARFAQDAT